MKNYYDNSKCNCYQYLRSYEQVKALIPKIQKKRIPGIMGFKPLHQEYFRGQVSNTFVLKPSLSRCFSDNESLLKIEKLLIDDFKKEMKTHNKIDKLSLNKNPLEFQNEWACLVQSQHYRLPTRMLDWTLKWEVALYFAVEEQFGDKEYLNSHAGQFWVFYVPDEIIMSIENQNAYYRTDPNKFNETVFLNPSFFWTNNYENETSERRRARQHGKFSIQSALNSLAPLEQQADIIPHLEKYCIPSNAKKQIRLALEYERISGDFLYAGEDDTINDIISSLKAKYGL